MRVSDFKTEAQLKAMKVADIKKHVREFNDHYAIRGYSKLKKDQLINAVLTATQRIKNSKGTQTPPAPAPAKKKPVKKKKLKIVSPEKKEEIKVTKKDIDNATKAVIDGIAGTGNIPRGEGFVLNAITSFNPSLMRFVGGANGRLTSRGFDLNERVRSLKKTLINSKLKKPVKKLLESLQTEKGMEKFFQKPSFRTFQGLLDDTPGFEGIPVYSFRMEGDEGLQRKMQNAKTPFAVMIKTLTPLIEAL